MENNTNCQVSKTFLKTLITEKNDEYGNIFYEEHDENLDEFFGMTDTGIKTNSWYTWGL